MTFRVTHPKGAVGQIVISSVWILATFENLHQHSRYAHPWSPWIQDFVLILWTLNLLSQIYFYFFGTAEFTRTTLCIRQGIRSVFVPYSSIVSFAPACDANGTVRKSTVELEIAKLSHDIYPHEYRELRVTDVEGFMAALRQYVPNVG